MILYTWAGKILNLVPFYLVTDRNPTGTIGCRFGLMGTENTIDLQPFNLVYKRWCNHVLIKNTSFHISWLGLIRQFTEMPARRIPGTDKPEEQWLLVPPWLLSIKGVLP